MRVEVKIQLTSPMLGDQRHPDQVRRFNRPQILQGDIQLNIGRWHWALGEGLMALGLDQVRAEDIMVQHHMRTPTLELYNRRWKQKKGGKTVQCQEMFESIRAGAQLTFQIMVPESRDPDDPDQDSYRRPSLDEIRKVFEIVGETIGISPWGSKFGFGRFRVLSVQQLR